MSPENEVCQEKKFLKHEFLSLWKKDFPFWYRSFSPPERFTFLESLSGKVLSGRKSFLRKFQNIKFSSPSKMWVLRKINQNQDFASGKFSSQFQLAEFMGIHPRTLNKALSEDRNSFVFRGELVSVHQLPEFSAEDSSGNHQFFEKKTQIVEFFNVSRQTVYLAFKNANEKVFKKAGVKWTVKRLLQECEAPICKDQR